MLDRERRLVAASPAAAAALGDATPGRRLGEEQLAGPSQPLVLFLEEVPELSAYQELRAGLHRRRLARAADAARPPARPARERDAAGGRRRRARRAGPAGGAAGARADRRRPLPRRARDGPRGRVARTDERAAGAPRRSPAASPAARSGRRSSSSSRAAPEIELPLRPRMLRVVLENLVANAIRYAGLGTTCTVSVTREGPATVLSVADDGKGVSRGRRAAPLRALLPRRPGALEPRHRPRARDREARRHRRRRHGRGDERPRARARDRRPAATARRDGRPGHGLEIAARFPARWSHELVCSGAGLVRLGRRGGRSPLVSERRGEAQARWRPAPPDADGPKRPRRARPRNRTRAIVTATI